MNKLKNGIYRHFKGNLYEVLETARHCETEAWYVVYRALYGERGTWIRPLDDFCAVIERDGRRQARFTLVDEANGAPEKQPAEKD